MVEVTLGHSVEGAVGVYDIADIHAFLALQRHGDDVITVEVAA